MSDSTIRHMGGVIYCGDLPVTWDEAEILRVVIYDQFDAAVRAKDAGRIAHWREQEQALRVATHWAAIWRRCAGWANPADADKGERTR